MSTGSGMAGFLAWIHCQSPFPCHVISFVIYLVKVMVLTCVSCSPLCVLPGFYSSEIILSFSSSWWRSSLLQSLYHHLSEIFVCSACLCESALTPLPAFLSAHFPGPLESSPLELVFWTPKRTTNSKRKFSFTTSTENIQLPGTSALILSHSIPHINPYPKLPLCLLIKALSYI